MIRLISEAKLAEVGSRGGKDRAVLELDSFQELRMLLSAEHTRLLAPHIGKTVRLVVEVDE